MGARFELSYRSIIVYFAGNMFGPYMTHGSLSSYDAATGKSDSPFVATLPHPRTGTTDVVIAMF